MGRNLSDVIDAMLAHVPAGQVLRPELAKLKSDAAYFAPERMAEGWARGMQLLAAEFGADPPTDGWQGEVYRAWMGQS